MTIHYSRKKLERIFLCGYYLIWWIDFEIAKKYEKLGDDILKIGLTISLDDFDPKKLWKRLSEIYKIIKPIKTKKIKEGLKTMDLIRIIIFLTNLIVLTNIGKNLND